MRFDWQIFDPLAVVDQGPGFDVEAESRQQAVVMASAASQPVALGTKGQTRDEHPVNGFGRDLPRLAARLGNTPYTRLEVPGRVIDLKEPEPALGSIDSRAK